MLKHLENNGTEIGLVTPTAGALGFNIEKNLESRNCQQCYSDAHLMPWHKVQKIPAVQMCYSRWSPSPLVGCCNFFIMCHRKALLVCVPMFSKARNTIEWLNRILLIILRVKIHYGCHYKVHIITDIRMWCNQSNREVGLSSEELPPPPSPIGSQLAYIQDGHHEMLTYQLP